MFISAGIWTKQIRCLKSVDYDHVLAHMTMQQHSIWIEMHFDTNISPSANILPCDLEIAVVHITILIKFHLIVRP